MSEFGFVEITLYW